MVFLDKFIWKNKVCGHLFSDSSFEELHAFAVSIGLKPEWFQADKKVPHYDVIGTRMRSRALDAGAVQCGRKEILLKGLRAP